MLSGLKVLVVEDELLVGYDIIGNVEDYDGTPIGPVQGVAEALAVLNSQDVDRAIVDYNLLDGDAQPLLVELRKRGIPTLVLTGGGMPAGVLKRFPGLSLVTKPMHPIQVFQHLLVTGHMVDVDGDSPIPLIPIIPLKPLVEVSGREPEIVAGLSTFKSFKQRNNIDQNEPSLGTLTLPV